MHYMDSTSTLVTNVFRTQQASETYVKHVKRTVSCVASSLNLEYHPVYTAIAKPMKGVCSMLYFIQTISLKSTVYCSSLFPKVDNVNVIEISKHYLAQCTSIICLAHTLENLTQAARLEF
jgi:hypothetical protein